MWAIVTVAVIAALVAAAVPTLSQWVDTTRVTTTAETLRDIAVGIDSFNNTAKTGPTKYTTPRYLHLLDTIVVNGDSAGCRSNIKYNAASVTGWTTNGPYVSFYISPYGVDTPIGRVGDSTSRSMGAFGSRRTSQTDSVFIQIDSVDVGLARMMDLDVDGTVNANGDTVRFTAPGADSLVLLSWWVPLPHGTSC